jgi:CRISPR system Cascade subunit CasC
MIGTVAFGSATYYRYGRVDVQLLKANLGQDVGLTRATVAGFLRAFLYALPTGKQNTFAAHNLPEFVIGVVRPDQQGWSLANAFETPVRPTRDGGYMIPSIKALAQHWLKMERAYGLNAPKATAILNVRSQPLEMPADLGFAVEQTDRAGAWLELMAAAVQTEA